MVLWADEILIVDSFSTDKTIEVANSYPTRIIQRAYENSASQKNWAIPQASHEWIFLIDADERPDARLIEEVKNITQTPFSQSDAVAYWIGRDNHFMGERIKYCGWQGDQVVRLFRKSECTYEARNVHAEIQTNGGAIGKLKGRLLHYTFKSIDHFMEKMKRYAKWSAKDHESKTGSIGLYHLWFKPAFRFFKHYVIQLGFLDGKVGFVVCKVLAWGVFLRYIYMKEMRMSSHESKTD